MRNLLLLICSLFFAQHGVNAGGQLQDYKDTVDEDIDDDVLHLADDVDNHQQRVLDPTPPDTPVNPHNFSGYDLYPGRTKYVGQDEDDTCGLTCRGPDQYAFGLLSCLRTAFEKEGVMPDVTISTSKVVDDIELPKVVFSPSTSLVNDEFDLEDYNKARRSWINYSRLPGAILFAETTEDVVHGVNCARVNGYKVSPRGRGHDSAGLSSVEGSLVIDMQLNCKLDDFVADKTVEGEHILPGSKYIGTMKAPSGCSNAVFLAAVYDEFKDDGGMNVCGACPSVGITGYILNGGYGDTTPYTGTAADLVTEIEMVLYDGTTITASKDEHEDIFLASKGGTGGIGVITSFVARIIENPSPTKKFTRFRVYLQPFTNATDETQIETQVESLMRFQKLTYHNPNGVRFGGGYLAGVNFGYTFLGSINELLTVFHDAGLLDPKLLSTEGESLAQRDFIQICEGKTCSDKFDKRFPQFGLRVYEFDTQAEAQVSQICTKTCTLSGNPEGGIGWTKRTIDVCADLGIAATYCKTDLASKLKLTYVKEDSCYNAVVIKAILNAAKEPQGFLNRKGPSEATLSFFGKAPNTLALGFTPGFPIGQGIGGLVIPELQEETIRNILRIYDPINDPIQSQFNVGHLIHGAPLTVPPKSTGYPHRNTGMNLAQTGVSPEFVNALLGDRAYQGDPINLQIYGNYQPSVRTPDYERHVYVDKIEELSRIRSLYDPLGGFDSPRYVQRRSAPRTVPQYKNLVPVPVPAPTPTPTPAPASPPEKSKSKKSKSEKSKSNKNKK
mmetsp:Transcript_25844/g.27788  ORF Transcript_25844/g.27788 Transcript_25844/m.27788 type:complete len:783 (+) Transcript_25844:76-2424(+)